MSPSTVDDLGTPSVPSVGAVGSLLRDLLVRAESVKGTTSLEPPLDQSDFNDLQGQMTRILGPIDTGTSKAAERRRSQRFAIIETAARSTLYSLIVSCDLIVGFPASLAPQAQSKLIILGDSIYQLSSLRQGVEPFRHPLFPLGQRAMRPRPTPVAGRGVARQPNHYRVSQSL